mmetsp:Transcript_27836/g.67080  ORF Transcript_27836/g.67080 Transcript_27836/m.67080 type:complete len:206 (-) Transcript_27836:424-1041(-)
MLAEYVTPDVLPRAHRRLRHRGRILLRAAAPEQEPRALRGAQGREIPPGSDVPRKPPRVDSRVDAGDARIRYRRSVRNRLAGGVVCPPGTALRGWDDLVPVREPVASSEESRVDLGGARLPRGDRDDVRATHAAAAVGTARAGCRTHHESIVRDDGIFELPAPPRGRDEIPQCHFVQWRVGDLFRATIVLPREYPIVPSRIGSCA